MLLGTLYILMVVQLLSGCAVQIQNERWYGDEGSKGAAWFETLTSDVGKVDKQDWDNLRIGMACTTTGTLANIKKEIEELCSSTACDYEKVSAILGKFQERLDDLARVRN